MRCAVIQKLGILVLNLYLSKGLLSTNFPLIESRQGFRVDVQLCNKLADGMSKAIVLFGQTVVAR